MILMSPSEDAGQVPPVTTTFDPPGRRRGATGWGRRASQVDWDRVQTLHAFVRGRACERMREAERSGDVAAGREVRQSLHAIDAMYIQARHGHPVVTSCAITFFRARAMRDADHPDFLGEWLGASAMGARTA